jgi:hypothetical protein
MVGGAPADPDRPDPRDEGFALPLDALDPRFVGEDPGTGPEHARRLVRSAGPGGVLDDPRVRILRVAIPLLSVLGALAVAAVFWRGLDPASGVEVVGAEAAVRAAVADRPHRVCLAGAQPCAWLTVLDGRLLALSTSGPLREEFGRAGVGWCPTSGHFGSNSLGSRFDQAGTLVRGPAPRGMDRYELRVDERGRVTVDFLTLTTGLQRARVEHVLPPEGPDCPEIPFDREADLSL